MLIVHLSPRSFALERVLNPAVCRWSRRVRLRGRNPFAGCHGQTPAIIPADFECNDEVSFTDPRGTWLASRPAKVSRVLSSSNRLDVRGRPRGRECAERAALNAAPGN